MHLALPSRKTSYPLASTRTNPHNAAASRRRKVQYLGYLIFTVLTIYLVLTRFWSDTVPLQSPLVDENASVLIVTVLDEDLMNEEYIALIKSNRDAYAKRHGYQTFYTNVSTYTHLTETSPSSWAMIPALRNSLTKYPSIDYIWYLSAHAVITNTSSLHTHVFSRLPELMLKDIPVVPPDSVIHTFSHLKPSQVYLILSQDAENVAHTSFILRNTGAIPVQRGSAKDNWTHFFLDAWFDPLYRAYAFQKAENHALEHIIQWHPTILAKLVMIQQRVFNSYTYQIEDKQGGKLQSSNLPEYDGQWQQGDLVVNLKGCLEEKDRDCLKEMKLYYKEWQDASVSEDRSSSLKATSLD